MTMIQLLQFDVDLDIDVEMYNDMDNNSYDLAHECGPSKLFLDIVDVGCDS